MSDHVIPPPDPEEIGGKPHAARPGSGADAGASACADQVSEDVAELVELAAAGVEVDGELQIAESTWVLYGHTSYDGEIVVGEYHDAFEASEVLRAAPRSDPDDGRPAP